MRKTASFLFGVMIVAASAAGNEETVFLDAICPVTPQVILDQATFCNTSAINVPGAGVASQYPSAITVTGLAGVISDLKVRMLDVTHANTSTLQALLQPPSGLPIGLTGSSFLVSSPEAPNQRPVPTASSAQWTFTEQANDYALFNRDGVPQLSSTAPVAGSYLPRTFTLLGLPAPAPGATESQSLASQIGQNPNGTWQLFVNQAVLNTPSNPQPTGTIAGGWCVDLTTTASSTGCYASTVLSGAITTSDLLQTGRINRNGIVSLCTWPKTNSLFATTSLHYDAYAVVNPAAQETCITLTSDFAGCGGNSTQPVVYTSYDPANPGNNVLADAGYSSVGRLQMSFRRGAGQPFTIVVHEVSANAGCPAYALLLEQNRCRAVPIGDLIFRNGFD